MTDVKPSVPDPDNSVLDNAAPVEFPGEHDALLAKLQGNILKGHGRDHAAYLFLHFDAGATPAAIRAEIKRLAARYVVSAREQLVHSRQRRAWGIPGGLFGNLFLSHSAYRKLNYPASQLDVWFADPPEDHGLPQQACFVNGMRAAADDFGDRIPAPTEALETAYLSDRIDALLLLADDSEPFLLRTVHEEMARLAGEGIAEVVAIERGAVLRNASGDGIEHFGYVDGLSQPLFLHADVHPRAAHRSVIPALTETPASDTANIDHTVWDPFAPLSLALLADPAVQDPDAFGSYYVFRKLEQDVRGFAAAEQRLADALGLEGAARARAGAMVVGRFRDGTPLALSESSGFEPGGANNFRYDGLDAAGNPAPGTPVDPLGLKCPFQAHIRKVNPRQNATPDLSEENVRRQARTDWGRRIVRRGITYGTRAATDIQSIDDLPSGGVGLLFGCFQSSIMRQFGFIQSRWANDPTFMLTGKPERLAGIDTVIGQDIAVGDGVERLQQHWRPEYGGTLPDPPARLDDLRVDRSHPTSFRFAGFVRFRGGEFFFAPSLPFLLDVGPQVARDLP